MVWSEMGLTAWIDGWAEAVEGNFGFVCVALCCGGWWEGGSA